MTEAVPAPPDLSSDEVSGTVSGPEIARTEILGHPVDAVSFEQATQELVERGLKRAGGYVCLTNVHTTVASQDSAPLREAAEHSWLSVPDGMPLVWILKRRGYAHTSKVTGIEYVPAVAQAGQARGLKHLFYGGAPGIAQAAADRLKALVPGVEIVAALSPPFTKTGEWDLSELRQTIEQAQPHVVWIGLGAPKQELFMAVAAAELEGPVLVGVGAAFDFLAGTKRPAPRFLSRIGLEWLFRLIAEPRRLWRRYLLGNGRFILLLIRERTTGRRS